MSRIGKKSVAIPAGVNVSVNDRTVTVQGRNGTLTFEHRPEVSVNVQDNAVVVTRSGDQRQVRALHGTTRALINNMITGVSEGWKKELEIGGVGWTAQVQGRTVRLSVGYADAKVVNLPMGVDVQVQGNKITVSGNDRQQVGQVAAVIRSQRKPEPYNAKGIKYADEIIVRKHGKAFAGGGG